MILYDGAKNIVFIEKSALFERNKGLTISTSTFCPNNKRKRVSFFQIIFNFVHGFWSGISIFPIHKNSVYVAKGQPYDRERTQLRFSYPPNHPSSGDDRGVKGRNMVLYHYKRSFDGLSGGF